MIRTETVSKTYKTGAKALQDVSIDIAKGEFVFVVGPSGSGKSTLIRLILREEDPTQGRIYVAGKDIGKMSADGRCSDHGRRHQMRARARTLTAAEVPVGGRGTTFARRHQVAVDANAHGATGIRPFQSSVAENTIESFVFRLPFYG